MASSAAVDLTDEVSDGPTLRQIGRAAAWTTLAVLTLAAAIAAARSETGLRRINEALERRPASAGLASKAAAQAMATSLHHLEAETRRLAQAVQMLAAERDRILKHMAALEGGSEMTGSVAVTPEWDPPKAPAPPGSRSAVASVNVIPPPQADAAAMSAPTPAAAKTTARPAQSPEDQRAGGEPAAESPVTRTRFGIDLGPGPDLNALRNRWEAVRNRHAALLDGLQPLVAVRESSTKGIEVHLIAGPLTNAAVAARLCAVLTETHPSCQTGPYEGQALAPR